jgi:antitoxin component YwqK of YwqJK toxin-antitoxin module
MVSVTPPQKVPYDDLDYDGDLVYTYQGHPYTGIAFEDVPGKWYTELSFEDGLQTGWGREWLPSGTLKSESEYRYNVLHGESREFDEDGHLRSRSQYEYGILVSKEDIDPEGQIRYEWKIGKNDSLYQMLIDYRSSAGWPAGPSGNQEDR